MLSASPAKMQLMSELSLAEPSKGDNVPLRGIAGELLERYQSNNPAERGRDCLSKCPR